MTPQIEALECNLSRLAIAGNALTTLVRDAERADALTDHWVGTFNGTVCTMANTIEALAHDAFPQDAAAAFAEARRPAYVLMAWAARANAAAAQAQNQSSNHAPVAPGDKPQPEQNGQAGVFRMTVCPNNGN